MSRPADARKSWATLARLGCAGFAAAAALWYFDEPANAPHDGAQRAVSVPTAAPLGKTAQRGSIPVALSLPASLAGSAPPRLPLDAHGHLRKARGVRDFFDYFMAAQNEIAAGALDVLVRKAIAAQLDAMPAQSEALELWRRYTSYRQALGHLEQLSAGTLVGSASSTSGASEAIDAMQSVLDERVSLASRTLGADWSEAFFGADWQRAHYMIERLRIIRDSALTDAQKTARLQALDDSLPPEARAALGAEQRARETVDVVAKLRQEGMTVDQLRAKATQALGPQAAERIVRMRRDDDAWRAKYADYAAQRAGIDAMGLMPADRDAQVEQLRRRIFANPAQALRAASLDHGAGG